MRELTQEDLSNVEQMGRYGFSYKDVAKILEIPEPEVAKEFENEKGKIYSAWAKGRLQVELDLRKQILADALAGDKEMVNNFRAYLYKSDEENSKLIY